MSRAAKAYSNNAIQLSVSAADSRELVILVYERIFDHLKIGMNEMQSGGYAIERLSSAHDLIQKGLLACLDYKTGGEIAANLKLIYEWAMLALVNARLEKSPEKLQEVIDVLVPLYEGWTSLATSDHPASPTNQRAFALNARAVNT
jgi:flagellar protein FliS